MKKDETQRALRDTQRRKDTERNTRLATREDTPEIVRVINLAYRVEDFFVNGDRTATDDIEARMADPDGDIIVIDADKPGALAAAVCVDVHESRGHFAMLSVDPAFQGRGYGRLLIAAVEEYCRTRSCHSLDLEVVDLREELPPFYEAFGFTTSGMSQFTNPGKLRREAHLIQMTKSLATQ